MKIYTVDTENIFNTYHVSSSWLDWAVNNFKGKAFKDLSSIKSLVNKVPVKDCLDFIYEETVDDLIDGYGYDPSTESVQEFVLLDEGWGLIINEYDLAD